MNHAEQKIHIAIVHWIRVCAPPVIAFHPANGGWRSQRAGALFKAMGVVPGVFDLVLLADPPGPAIAFLEVKAPGGVLSDDQKAFQSELMDKGISYAVVHSIDEVRAIFRHWRIATREVAA